MLRRVVLAHFEPVLTRFGAWKSTKCPENGSFWEQKWGKNGSTTWFSTRDPGPFRMLKQVFLAHFYQVLTEVKPQFSRRLGVFVVCLEAILGERMAAFGAKRRTFGTAPPDLAPLLRAPTPEFLAQHFDFARAVPWA